MKKKRHGYCNVDPNQGLEVAILKVAANDYKEALRGKQKDPFDDKTIKEIKKLEKFFLSNWGQFLSGYQGELIIEKCRQVVYEGG